MTYPIPVIAFFNNKGGVGKTTLVYHLAWMFAQMGLTVLAADLDPQANLTAAALSPQMLERWLDPDRQKPLPSIYSALYPLIVGTGDAAKVAPQALDDHKRLFLLPGDLGLSRFEQQLSDEWAGARNGEVRALRVTSALWRIIQTTAGMIDAHVILIDMGPNLGAINRTILISSDYLVVPMTPDLYSLQGLHSLGTTLARWRRDWGYALERREDDTAFSLPRGVMQPLGYIVIQHLERQGKDGHSQPIEAYRKWIDRIPHYYAKHVLNVDDDDGVYDTQIGLVRHYQSLMAMSQEARKPIFHLQHADGVIGAHLTRAREAEANFRDVAISILDKIGMRLSLE